MLIVSFVQLQEQTTAMSAILMQVSTQITNVNAIQVISGQLIAVNNVMKNVWSVVVPTATTVSIAMLMQILLLALTRVNVMMDGLAHLTTVSSVM